MLNANSVLFQKNDFGPCRFHGLEVMTARFSLRTEDVKATLMCQLHTGQSLHSRLCLRFATSCELNLGVPPGRLTARSDCLNNLTSSAQACQTLCTESNGMRITLCLLVHIYIKFVNTQPFCVTIVNVALCTIVVS